METIEQPAVLAMPFANNGTKNALPTAATGTGAASLAEGFPLLTSTSIADNGVPPSRADMNGLGYVSTAYAYLMQCGGVYTYRNDVATTIGGYPLNALLWYVPTNGIPNLLRSTIANNTNNFNEDSSVIGNEGSGKPWEIVTVSPTNFVTTNTAQSISGEKTFSVSPIVPTATSGDSSTKAASTEFVTIVASSLQTQVNAKANASDVVTLAGTQTVSGQKTFSSVAYGTASDANNSILTTVAKTKAAKGGFKLGNGMIVNWGTVSGSGGTVTYSVPFSGTNYGISMTRVLANGTNDNDAITAVTSTNFSATIYQGGGARWVAIGY